MIRESALFDDEFLHGTAFKMASAYRFHLARNHPFVDSNERTTLMCALVFLGLNGYRLDANSAGESRWALASASSPPPT